MSGRVAGTAVLAVVLAVASPTAARADFLFSWDFTNSGAVVQAGDTFTARAIITNTSTNGEILLGSDIQGAGAGFLSESAGQFGYQFGQGGDLYSQFSGLALRAGESFEFDYFTFAPGAATTAGRHGLQFASLSVLGWGQVNAGSLPFEFFIDDGTLPNARFRSGNLMPIGGPRAVPEPGIMLLFGLGLIVLARRLIRRRA